MKGLSNHTKMMNIIFCLCNKNRRCNPVLYNNHYYVETIEPQFNKIDDKRIHADISLINPKINNIVFIECKDGRLQNDQAERYHTLTQQDIKNAWATNLSGDFTHEIAYVCSEEKKDQLIEDMKTSSYNFPVVVPNELKIKLEFNAFKCKKLQEIFTLNEGVDVPTPLPIFYYPFGADDSDSYILSWIGTTLIKFIDSEFNIEDVLKATHNLYDYINDVSLGKIKARVYTLIKKASQNELNEFFDLPSKGKQFKLKNFGIKKFQRVLNDYISKSDKKKITFKQKEIGEFAP